MVAIVTRAGKGSPLTNAEVDANFTNLNNGKLETSNNLSDLANAATARTNLGLGSLATQNSITSLQVTTALGFTPLAPSAIGTTVQAYDADLAAIAALTPTADNFIVGNGTAWILETPAQARTSLGLGSLATLSSITSTMVTDALGYTPLNKAGDTTTGALGIGAVSLTGYNLRVGRNLTGSTIMYGVASDGVIQSDVTGTATLIRSLGTTAAASFTLGSLVYYTASQGAFGAGSTVTSQNGFVVESNFIGAGTNIGFRGAIPSGSNRWNLFMDGTAQNFLGGATILNAALGFGASGSPSFGSSGQFLKSGGSGAAPSWAALTSGEVTTALGFTPFSAAGGTITTTNSTASIIVSDTGTSGGNIRLTGNGATTPSKTIRAFNGNFEIVNSAYSAAILTVTDAGALTAANNITAYSDERMKKNWRDLSDDFIEALAQVKHGIYDRTDMISTQVGVSAQSLERVLANAIEKSASGILSVAYGNAALVSAVQLAKRVVLLQERLNRIEQKVGA